MPMQNALYWEQEQFVMCEWIHIYNDINSGQNMEKTIIISWWYKNEVFINFLNHQKT